ncbi:MAG TPA: ROK family protein [Pelobium sp.]|nr:ROK family protein [Pelobium sp.]
MEKIKIGVDIGGSHITAGLVNLEDGTLVKESLVRRSINSAAPYDTIINEWAQTISPLIENKQGYQVKDVCIAMPGPFDYKKGISLMQNQNKYDALYGLNVKELLAEKLNLPGKNIVMKNDASCFLLGEVYSGNMKGYHNVIGITLGTGLGSAHYVDGKIKDANLWKMSFKETIAEEYISTRWFTKRWKEIKGEEIKGVKEIINAENSQKEIDLLFEEFAENLTEFLYIFVKKKHPLGVVLGGNIMNAQHLFLTKVQKYLFEKKMGISIPISNSKHGEVAALIGSVL